MKTVMSMYTGVTSCVRDPKTFCNSNTFSCNLGVRQGDCLSPFLFAMYINDLEDELYLHVNANCGMNVFNLKLFYCYTQMMQFFF